MKFKPGDYPVDIDILPGAEGQDLPEGKSLVAVTVQGYGKRVGTDEFKLQVSHFFSVIFFSPLAARRRPLVLRWCGVRRLQRVRLLAPMLHGCAGALSSLTQF
jgi:hypothetical protein